MLPYCCDCALYCRRVTWSSKVPVLFLGRCDCQRFVATGTASNSMLRAASGLVAVTLRSPRSVANAGQPRAKVLSELAAGCDGLSSSHRSVRRMLSKAPSRSRPCRIVSHGESLDKASHTGSAHMKQQLLNLWACQSLRAGT